MLCYEVMLNGKRLCVAGVSDGVLVGALTWTGNHSAEPPQSRVNLHVGGISGDAHVDWAREPLAVGDEVVFCLTDSEAADPPTDLRPIDPVEARKNNLKMSRALHASLRTSLAALEAEWGADALTGEPKSGETDPSERQE